MGDFVADIPFAIDHPSRAALDAIEAGIRSVDVPALLLWGPRDPVFADRYLAELRERLPQAQLQRYEGASHLLPEDAPQYAEAVAQWLADLDRSPGATADAKQSVDIETPRSRRRPAVGCGRPSPSGRVTSRRRSSRSVGRRRAGPSWRGASTNSPRDWRSPVSAPDTGSPYLVPPSADLTAVYAVWRAGAVIVVADKGLGFAGMRRALRGAAVDHVIGSGQGLIAARLMRLPGSRIAASGMRVKGRRALAPSTT